MSTVSNDPTSDPPAGLAPGYLVASPSLLDPNFVGSLVLVAQHNEEGALGFIVNRPSEMDVAEVLSGIDEKLVKMAEGTDLSEGRVLLGGPVQPQGSSTCPSSPAGTRPSAASASFRAAS